MEEKKMKYESFLDNMGEDWCGRFKPFIESEEMWNIYQVLKKDNKNEGVAPESKNIFRSFFLTPFHKLKVIFYLMDPYPKKYYNGKFQATGIAMDSSNSPNGKMQPSLEKWYDQIDKSIGKECERSLSLEYLNEQGVMLLNSDLTCKLNKTASHEGLWESFQKYFLEEVMYSTTGIIYVLCGKSSQRLKKYINPLGNYVFELEHPVAASYRKDEWLCEDIFNKINKLLILNNGEYSKIFWDKKDWDEYKKPPF